MHPILFRLGDFAVSTYGTVLAVAVLAGGYVFGRGLEGRGIDREVAWKLLVYALAGAFLGARLYYVALHGDPRVLLSRAGFVWYGGLIGGLLTGAYASRRYRLPVGSVADAAAPALSLGHGIGHLGCFASGDSYGLPSDLPWAAAFPRGMPPSTAGNLRRFFGADIPGWIPDDRVLSVHPTMLYSAAALLLVFGILWALRRTRRSPGWLFGLYLVLTGLERFAVEFLRAKEDRFLWGFTSAQAIAVAAILGGVAVLVMRRARRAGPGGRVASGAGRWTPEARIETS